MSRPLRLIIVEDSPDDAELMIHSLNRNGIEPTWTRVETAAELESALETGTWDAVLSDYTLPEFGAAAAIEIVHAADPDLPVLVVSGTVGEDKAVETMRAGASDYVLKDNLVRLGPALDRELRAAENRQAKRAAEKLATHLAAIVESSVDAIVSENINGHLTSWNRGAEQLYGWTATEAIGRHATFLVPPDKSAERIAIIDRAWAGEQVGCFETVRLHRDGQRIDVSVTISPMRDAAGRLVGLSKTGQDIRERKRAENALRVSELRYRRLFEAAQDGVLIVDAASRQILDVNPFLANLLGYSHVELVGKELWEIGLFRDIEANKVAFCTLQEVGYVRYDDHPLVTKDGRQIDVEFVSNTYDVDGARKIQCNIRDITEQKQAVHALAVSEERYRTLIAATTSIVWNTPASGEFETEQPGWTAFTGQTFDELHGTGWLNAVHPDDQRNTAKVWTLACTERIAYIVEHRLRRADGQYRNMAVRAVPILDASGTIREWVGVHTDVTDQKLAEFERDKLLARLQLHIERMPLACILFNADFRITDWNPAAERILGYSKADALGMESFDLCPASFRPQATELLARIRALDMTSHSINENLTKDGRTITCEWFNTPLTSESGQFIGMLSLAQDITARREAEATLRQTEEQFRSAQHRLNYVVASSPAILFTVAISGPHAPGINWISDNLRELLGYPAETALGQEWWQKNTHPDDRDVVAEKFTADLQRKERGTYEFRFRHADGSYRWIRSELRMILDGTRQAEEVVGSWSDITDRKQLEEQFNQAQKMEAFGQLAGGVAHDFNNLLTIINGYSDIVMRGLAPDDKLRGFVKEILLAGERSAALTA